MAKFPTYHNPPMSPDLTDHLTRTDRAVLESLGMDPMHLELHPIPTPEIKQGDQITVHLKGKTLVVRGKMMEEILRTDEADLTISPIGTPEPPSEEPVDLTTLMLETLAEEPPTLEEIRTER